MFLFTLVQYKVLVKVIFQADFSICLFVFKTNNQFQTFATFILGRNLEFSKCKQNHGLSSVYITKENCNLCIWRITRRQKVKFRLTIGITFIKRCI